MKEIMMEFVQFTGFSYWNILPNLPWRVYRFLQIYYPTLIFLAVMGILLRWKRRAFEKAELFILSFLVFHLITISAFSPGSKRFAAYLVAITIPWAAIGIYEIRNMFVRIKYKYGLQSFHAFLILIIILQLPLALKPIRIEKVEQKAIGLWLKENVKKDAMIAAINPQEAFYADGKWVQIPREIGNYQELMKFVKDRKANYLIVDSSLRKEVPNLMEFIDKRELKEIHRVLRNNEIKTIVYEIID